MHVLSVGIIVINIIHLMTAQEGNICFFSRESQGFGFEGNKIVVPELAVIKYFVI